MTINAPRGKSTSCSSQSHVHDRASPSVVLLIASGPLAWCVANRLNRTFGRITVVQEHPETKVEIVRRRARLLGWPMALGQATWSSLMRILQSTAARRRDEIQGEHGLRPTPDADLTIHLVPSVNSIECRTLIASLNPEVVAVYGTRMLKAATLETIAVPCINYHAGITPKYRGQHPAYWALVNGDAQNAGVTIHLVDPGVDTGGVLYRKRVIFDARDTILTYQWVQLAEALPLFEQAINDALNRSLAPQQVGHSSQIFFPPTIWSYIRTGFTKGIW